MATAMRARPMERKRATTNLMPLKTTRMCNFFKLKPQDAGCQLDREIVYKNPRLMMLSVYSLRLVIVER